MSCGAADDLSQSSYQASRATSCHTSVPVNHSFASLCFPINLSHLLMCSAKAIASKIALDQILMAPVGTSLFYAVTSVLQGETSQVPGKLKEKLLPTLVASYTLWPAAHSINFKFVPSSQRILYTNIVSVSSAPLPSCASFLALPSCQVDLHNCTDCPVQLHWSCMLD